MFMQTVLMIFGLIVAAGLIAKLLTTGTLVPKDAPPPPGPLTRKIGCDFGGRHHTHYTVQALYACCKLHTGRDYWAEGINWGKVAQLEKELGIPLSPEAREAVADAAALPTPRQR